MSATYRHIMISVSELITDPDFAQAFTVQRSGGSFQLGGYVSAVTNVPCFGVITVAKEQDLETLPEGDRIGGSMLFYSTKPLYETNVSGDLQGTSGTSDVIAWRGQNYRIAKVFPYADYGYYKALGVRMSGE